LGKRAWPLVQAVPGAVGLQSSAADVPLHIQSVITDLQAAARTLGLQLIVVNARTDSDLEPAFASFSQQRVGDWGMNGHSEAVGSNGQPAWEGVKGGQALTGGYGETWPQRDAIWGRPQG
jgi:hypothetical protein